MDLPLQHFMGTAELGPHRWSNVLDLDGEFGRGDVALAGRPLEAYIEVAARCNLRCPMCPITVDPRYAPGAGLPPLLSPQNFERLVPFFPTLYRAYLVGLGEPLLNPHLPRYAERLASDGVETWLTTNGTLIHKREAEALVASGLTRITVSIDGATPATYERLRRHGKFDDVKRGLISIGAARNGRTRPIFVLSIVAMASNVHELSRLVELCAEVGADGVFAETLYPFSHPALEAFCEDESLANLPARDVEDLFEAARLRAMSLGVGWWSRVAEKRDLLLPSAAAASSREVSQQGTASHGNPSPASFETALSLPWPCSEPWATINVSASGAVRTCCFNNTAFGNLDKDGIETIWNSPAYQALRREHAKGRAPDSCGPCVRNGRLKRSAFLSLPDHRVVPRPSAPERDIVLLTPGDGELISGTAIVVGHLGQADNARALERAELPELFVDDSLIAYLKDYALIDGNWFAAPVPIGFVTEGAHGLSLRRDGRLLTTVKRLQVGKVVGNDERQSAVARLAIRVALSSHEPSPGLSISGQPHPIERWIVGPYGNGWLGVAVVDVSSLLPGPHDVELAFTQHPPHRSRLERLGRERAVASVTAERPAA